MAFALGARDDARRWLASVSARTLSRAPATTVAFAHYLECEMQVPDAERQAREASLAFIASPGEARVLAGVVASREAALLAHAGRKDDARAMAELAAPLLSGPGDMPSIWAARCDELRAELATTPDDRQHFLAEAISRYEALGQRDAAAQLREQRGPPKFEESVSRERPPIVVRLGVSGMDVAGEICVEGEEAGSVAFTEATGRTPALVHLRSDLEAARSQAIPYQVSRLLADEWFGTIRELGRLLGPRELWDTRLCDPSQRDVPPVDVRLEVSAPLLDTLPIECFAEQTDEPAYFTVDRRIGTLYRSVRVVDARRTHVTWVQRALATITGTRVFADGIEGPQTRAAVTAFQASVGLPATGQADGPTSALLFDRLRRLQRGDQRLRALVLAPAAELARSTGAEEEAAADRLARVYDEAGFETTVREGVAVAELRQHLHGVSPGRDSRPRAAARVGVAGRHRAGRAGHGFRRQRFGVARRCADAERRDARVRPVALAGPSDRGARPVARSGSHAGDASAAPAEWFRGGPVPAGDGGGGPGCWARRAGPARAGDADDRGVVRAGPVARGARGGASRDARGNDGAAGGHDARVDAADGGRGAVGVRSVAGLPGASERDHLVSFRAERRKARRRGIHFVPGGRPLYRDSKDSSAPTRNDPVPLRSVTAHRRDLDLTWISRTRGPSADRYAPREGPGSTTLQKSQRRTQS